MTMIAHVNGVEGGKLAVQKGADDAFKVILSDLTGDLKVLTGGAVALVIHDTADRRNAATATLAATLTLAAGGVTTVPLSAASATFGPGRLYGFIRFTASGGGIEYARKYTIIDVA